MADGLVQPWASCQIRKIVGCACTANAGNVFHFNDFKRNASQHPGMYHSTRVTHVPWCMSGSLPHGGGENVPGIPGAKLNFTYLVRGSLTKLPAQYRCITNCWFQVTATQRPNGQRSRKMAARIEPILTDSFDKIMFFSSQKHCQNCRE